MGLTTLWFQCLKRIMQKCFYLDGFDLYLDTGGNLERWDWRAVFLAK